VLCGPVYTGSLFCVSFGSCSGLLSSMTTALGDAASDTSSPPQASARSASQPRPAMDERKRHVGGNTVNLHAASSRKRGVLYRIFRWKSANTPLRQRGDRTSGLH